MLYLDRLQLYPQAFDYAGKDSRDEHPNLLQKFENCDRKKFYNIDTHGLSYKSCTIVIYDRNDSMIVEPVL